MEAEARAMLSAELGGEDVQEIDNSPKAHRLCSVKAVVIAFVAYVAVSGVTLANVRKATFSHVVEMDKTLGLQPVDLHFRLNGIDFWDAEGCYDNSHFQKTRFVIALHRFNPDGGHCNIKCEEYYHGGLHGTYSVHFGDSPPRACLKTIMHDWASSFFEFDVEGWEDDRGDDCGYNRGDDYYFFRTVKIDLNQYEWNKEHDFTFHDRCMQLFFKLLIHPHGSTVRSSRTWASESPRTSDVLVNGNFTMNRTLPKGCNQATGFCCSSCR